MKKHTVILGTLLAFIIPLYSHAEDLPLTVGSTTITKEEKSDATTTPKIRTFTICSQEAIEVRDTAIATSRLTYNISMSNALTERKNREKAAVALEDEGAKKEAIKASVETYKHQAKTAQTTLTQARKTAWQTFENDIKKCRELEDVEQVLASSTDEHPQMSKMMMKKSGEDEAKESKKEEAKSISDVIKVKLESLKSLFN
jgi:hypothetical protein